MVPTSTFARIRKLGTSWHGLCYCVQLLACGCVPSLASYPGFLVTAFAAYGTMKVSRCYGRETLR